MTVCQWELRVLRLDTLSALLVFLVGLLAALIVLHQIAAECILHQAAFVYRIDASIFGNYWSALSPASIVPTTIAVMIGLWWGTMDGALRSIEPYITMSKSLKDISSGTGLSYSAIYWFWASYKAAKKRSCSLACVTLGTTLSQILIVSMSALFEIQSGDSVRQLELRRSLEIRQIPIVSTFVVTNSSTYDPEVDRIAIQKLYLNDSESWIYGATNQLTLNGTEPLWNRDEWSFVPLNLSQISKGQSQRRYSGTNSDQSIQLSLSNVTINTPAIRARLECDLVDQIVNTSSWTTVRNIRYPSQSLINSKRLHTAYEIGTKIWSDTPFNTSVLSFPGDPRYCVNESRDTRRSALGYWSTLNSGDYPHVGVSWPVTFLSKWILGNAQYFYDLANYSAYEDMSNSFYSDFGRNSFEQDILLFTEVPLLQAVYCSPIIETADANITVDITNGRVQSYRILNDPERSDSPWLDVFVHHQNISSDCEFDVGCGDGPGVLYPNVTNSCGVLFIDALLGASFRAKGDYSKSTSEDLEDNAYSFRDRKIGLNLDLMSYAAYHLTGRDPEALLDSVLLINLTQRVFQTFFQHFVSDGVPLIDGGWAYQRINESLPQDLPPPIDQNRDFIAQRQYPMLNTNNSTIANVSETVDVLRMSLKATCLTISTLLWLIITTIFVIIMQYRHAHLMIRKVECIADVLVLIVGSDNFLKLVDERGIDLVKDDTVFTRLGWFRKIDGEVRYGIEVVGGENAVEWVEPPDDCSLPTS